MMKAFDLCYFHLFPKHLNKLKRHFKKKKPKTLEGMNSHHWWSWNRDKVRAWMKKIATAWSYKWIYFYTKREIHKCQIVTVIVVGEPKANRYICYKTETTFSIWKRHLSSEKVLWIPYFGPCASTRWRAWFLFENDFIY